MNLNKVIHKNGKKQSKKLFVKLDITVDNTLPDFSKSEFVVKKVEKAKESLSKIEGFIPYD